MWIWLHRLSSPRTFYRFAGKLLPVTSALTILLLLFGLYAALILAPADYKQGDGFRIMYIHVPAAFSSLLIYTTIASAAFIFLVWKIKLADMVIKVSAPIGASMTVLALFSGAVWGKPMWGTWWVWDARLTSECILLFLYLGVIALRQAFAEKTNGPKIVAFFTLLGFVDIPVIHFSVVWWNTLHQGSSLNLFSHTTIAPSMLMPLLVMLAGFAFLFLSLLLASVRTEILWRESATHWVKELVQQRLTKKVRSSAC